MSIENIVNKVKLISELKDIHGELFQVYKKLFDFKYKNDEEFKLFIENEYKENGVGSKEKKFWNDNFCHRASYTLLNKILFVRICEDKGFMRNTEDYIAGEVKDSHIGEKLSKIGLQKWGTLVTNYTLGELIKFAFDDMKQSYSNIALYKEDKYEMLNLKDEEFNLKYIVGDKDTTELVLEFEKVLNDIIEKLDTNNFNFKYTDGNILGDVYEKFMDRETRKAIGQFYTPEFVIEYILKNTVSEADVVENPFVTVADISCGSGHFLIMAYDILREKFLGNLDILKEKYVDEIYTIKKDGKEIQLTGNEYWVKEHVHYHILKHCIYGADIDSFAVQLTTINLLLKDLDNFTDQLNIIECDSLIKWEEDYDWKDLKEQLKEEFEVIDTTQSNLFGEEERFEQTVRKESYILNYKDISGVIRKEVSNREKAQNIIDMCEFWNKKFDYVVGNPPYGVDFITQEQKIYFKENYNTAKGKINTYVIMFERALNKSYCIGYIIPNLILSNSSMDNLRKMILDKGDIKSITNYGDKVFDMAEVPTCSIIINENEDNDSRILISNIPLNEEFKINKRIYWNNENYSFTLFNEKEYNFLNDISSGSNRFDEVAILNQGVITGNDNERVASYENLESGLNWKRTLRGRDINRYKINDENLYVNYNKELLACPRTENIFNVEKKIILRRTSDELIATLDNERRYILHTLYSVRVKKENLSIEYLLALVNSQLFNYVYKLYMKQDIGRAFAELRIYIVNQLPIKIPDINKASEIELEVKRIIEINDLIKLSGEEVYKIIESNDILNNYLKLILNNEKLVEERERLIKNIDQQIYDIYSVSDYFRNKVELKNKGKEHIDKEIFIEECFNNNRSLNEIFNKYDVSFTSLLEYRNEYISKIKSDSQWMYFNLDTLYSVIKDKFKINARNYINNCEKAQELNEIQIAIKEQIKNFEKLILIIKKDNLTKRSSQIIKEVLNTDAYTWNAYKKDKVKDKVAKTFVKYYNSDYYGLVEWSDEIHKQYFMDAIDEYTVNNPNEKKAKDILKLFLDLDIEDKEDYIDVIQSKIKRAFN